MLVKREDSNSIQTLGQKKKFWQEEGLFIAEGPKLVQELLEADASMVQEVFALKEWIVENEKILVKKTITEITETGNWRGSHS